MVRLTLRANAVRVRMEAHTAERDRGDATTHLHRIEHAVLLRRTGISARNHYLQNSLWFSKQNIKCINFVYIYLHFGGYIVTLINSVPCYCQHRIYRIYLCFSLRLRHYHLKLFEKYAIDD